MAINPFSMKPQVDHEKLIEEFVRASKPIFGERKQFVADVDQFEKETLESKAEISRFLETIDKASTKEVKSVYEQYDRYMEDVKKQLDEFREEAAYFVAQCEDALKKVEKSTQAMDKAGRKRYNDFKTAHALYKK